MTLGNLPRWLYPRVEELLPFPPGKVWGWLGSSTQKAGLTDADRKAIGRQLHRGLAAVPMEARARYARNAATTRWAAMSDADKSALGRAGGIASQAARTPKQKREFGRRAAAVTNKIRWGTNG